MRVREALDRYLPPRELAFLRISRRQRAGFDHRSLIPVWDVRVASRFSLCDPGMFDHPSAQTVPGGRREEVVPTADAIRRSSLTFDQDHQAEFVGRSSNGRQVEIRQEDALFTVVFHHPPSKRRCATGSASIRVELPQGGDTERDSAHGRARDVRTIGGDDRFEGDAADIGLMEHPVPHLCSERLDHRGTVMAPDWIAPAMFSSTLAYR